MSWLSKIYGLLVSDVRNPSRLTSFGKLSEQLINGTVWRSELYEQAPNEKSAIKNIVINFLI